MTENVLRKSSSLVGPWPYFAATLGWSWLFWLPMGALGINVESSLGRLLAILGLMGPAVVGVALTYLTQGPEGRRDYWARVIDLRRISIGWLLVIVLFAPALNLLAALIDILLGGVGAVPGELALQAVANPLAALGTVLFLFFIGPFFEELGWRGYVLDRLQAQGGAARASLIVGVVWALWHVPLFFIPGTYQYGLGAFTPAFWLFMIGVVPLAFLFTWIYNHTGRSIGGAMLFHLMINVAGEVIATTLRAESIAMALWWVAAGAIVALWGARTMTRERG